MLRLFDLVETDRKKRTAGEGLKLAQFYCDLIGGVVTADSPERREALFDLRPTPRGFVARKIGEPNQSATS